MVSKRMRLTIGLLLGFAAGAANAAAGNEIHAVDVSTLPPLGEEMRTANPYTGNPEAIKIGQSAYTQNCARCHGIDAISGGITPDLRKMDSDCMDIKDATKKAACLSEIDTFFIIVTKGGVSRNGAVYMPPFGHVFSQEAIWAIRSFIETRRVPR